MRAVVIATALCLGSIAGASVAADNQAAAKKFTSIPAQGLGSALRSLAEARDFQIVYSSQDVANLSTQGVEGEVTADQALRQILKGTGLSYRYVDEKTVTIQPLPTGNDTTAKDAAAATSGEMQQVPSSERLHLARADQAPTAGEMTAEKPGAAREAGRVASLEEVIVTATKREERLIEVPQSVSVLSADSLAKLGAVQLRDFADTVPGLNFSSTGTGYTQVSLRGVTTGNDVSPTVAIYIDEVPYGSTGSGAGGSRLALDVGLFDIDRIEVLRGPQGTLYGASTMGGIIKYVTAPPSTESFSGRGMTGVSTTARGAVSYNGAAMVNLPIAQDQTALRLSGFYSHDGGYIDNVALGRKDVNQSDTYGGRADLLFTPTDALTLRLAAFFQDISREGLGVADFSYAGVPIDGDLEQRRLFPEPFDQKFRSVSLTLTYDLQWAALTSISSYQSVETLTYYDLSPSWLPIAASLGRSYSAVGYFGDIDTRKFVQELRLVSREGDQPLGWVIGGFYSDESSPSEEGFLFSDLAGRPAPNDIFHLTREPQRYEEAAIFGDLTWHLTGQFDVTGGVRYASNRTKLVEDSSGLFGGAPRDARSSDGVYTYLANARYRFSDHATAYLRYATGYRLGGPNTVPRDPLTGAPLAPPTFDSDQLESYEIGFKGETEDRRVGIDVAAYDVDWNDIQVIAVRNGFGLIANAGGARVRGVELALNARPTSSLTLQGAFTYTDAKLSTDAPDLGAAEGERLPVVPRFTAALNADYAFLTADVQPTIGMTLRYVSDRHAGFDDSTVQPQYLIPDYTTVDARAGLTLGSVYAQLYVRNVFDERGQLSTYAWNTRWAQPGILQPRTIGVMATMQF